MPITITPIPGSVSGIGWGTQWQAQSDFIGPLPSDAHWFYRVSTDSEATQLVFTGDTRSQLNPTTISIGHGNISTGFGQVSVSTGTPVFLSVTLETGTSTVLDSGQVAHPWAVTQQEPLFTAGEVPVAGGGFTTNDRALLTNVSDSVVPARSIDTFGLQEITSGPQGGLVDAQLPGYVFAIIVRISSIPDEFVSNTPDANYFFPALAVVSFFRGNDLWQRIPIHTQSKLIPFEGEGFLAAIANVTGTLWLANMHVEVAFRVGVTGQAFLMHVPL